VLVWLLYATTAPRSPLEQSMHAVAMSSYRGVVNLVMSWLGALLCPPTLNVGAQTHSALGVGTTPVRSIRAPDPVASTSNRDSLSSNSHSSDESSIRSHRRLDHEHAHDHNLGG